MRPTKSSGLCSWIKRCLAQLALYGTLCAAEPDAADGKPLFDAAALSGKAVIAFADCSVRSFPIEPDGRVLINGLDIFDPKQPFWENSKPNIMWPQRPER